MFSPSWRTTSRWLLATTTTRRLTRSWPSAWRPRAARCSTWRYRPQCSKTSLKASPRLGSPPKAGSSWRSPSAGTGHPPDNSTTVWHKHSPSPTSSASTTTSARNPSKVCSSSGSRMRSWNRSGTAATSPASRSPWPKRWHRRSSRVLRRCRRRPRLLQNHLLQVVALLAMEPPIADHADAYRDEELKILRQIEPLDPTNTVRGQYVGYLDEPGVAKDSTTETFVSTRLAIQSWRWAGVPFHVRTGKCMPGGATEAVIELHRPPRLLFAGQTAALPEANLIRFRLGHNDGLTMSFAGESPWCADCHPTCRSQRRLRCRPRTPAGSLRTIARRCHGRPTTPIRPRRHHRRGMAHCRTILDHTDRPSPYYKGTWGPSSAEMQTGGWHGVSVQSPAS